MCNVLGAATVLVVTTGGGRRKRPQAVVNSVLNSMKVVKCNWLYET